MGKDYSFVTDKTVVNLLQNATAKWIVQSLDKDILTYIFNKYGVSNEPNPLAAIVAVRDKLGIWHPSCEAKVLSEITVCDDVIVRLNKIDDTRILLYVVYEGIRYPIADPVPAEVGWENYSLQNIGSGNSTSGDAYIALTISKVEWPVLGKLPSMDICFKFYRTGNKELFHVGEWSQNVSDHFIFDSALNDFKLCANEDIVVEDNKRVLCSLQLLNDITLKLVKNSQTELCLHVLLRGAIVARERFSQNYIDCNKYRIEDINSEVSKEGSYSLRFAVVVNDLSAIPAARKIFINIKKEGMYRIEMLSEWQTESI